ncbi:MAG: AAA-like domain-containing protein [Candidatus Electrothrix sp. GW3-4]|uniref:AAA family ATPase n=1 Tax=Candidatus Electrothrix sp. GW3-4 TaxID=3126740 RepID=UPI0030D1053E
MIHAPRQTGKTTLLRNLSRKLTQEGRYAALTCSLENFTQPDPERMLPRILAQLEYDAQRQLPKELNPPAQEAYTAVPDLALQQYLSDWAEQITCPLVIFFDEIDSLPGAVLLSLLRQLRNGYCSRPAPFPLSIALVGLKDVRDYKISLRQDAESLGTASPFNIKARSLTMRNFNQEEVQALLEQYTQATGQPFTTEAAAEIFRLTQGQPWLTNALAAQLVTDYDALIKDRSCPITKEAVNKAREILIERRDTHLDSLTDKLREKRVRAVIEPIMVGKAEFDQAFDNDFVYAKNLGLVSDARGRLEIANPIYQEIIPRVLTYPVQMAIPDEPAWFVTEDGTLDIMKLIKGFIRFWQRNGEVLLRGMPYHEAAPHLVFMAYLQRVINSGGSIEREFAIGTGRADLVIDFKGRQDIIELKLLRGSYTRTEGVEQVARYATWLCRDRGYLVIFDPTEERPWEERGRVETKSCKGVKVIVLEA